MPGKAIGIAMNVGYPGSFARNADCIIVNRPIKSTDDAVNGIVPFGGAVVLNTDNTYSKFGLNITGTLAAFAGFAVREVKQTSDYYNPAGAYKPGESADVIERGAVCVVCKEGTPTAGGKVYICTVAGSTLAVGDLSANSTSSGATLIELANCRWTTGVIDANLVAELTIMARNNP